MGSQVLTVASGASVVYEAPNPTSSLPASLTVTIDPNGGTVTVSTKTAYAGAYHAVADGDLSGYITAVKTAVLGVAVNAVKFTASGATATIEIAE